MAVLRTKISTNIHGGMSARFAELLKITFEGPVWLSRGLVVELPEPLLVCGRFGMFLADGDAERATWTCKGASGLRPCCLCQNCFSTRGEPHLEDHSDCGRMLFHRGLPSRKEWCR